MGIAAGVQQVGALVWGTMIATAQLGRRVTELGGARIDCDARAVRTSLRM